MTGTDQSNLVRVLADFAIWLEPNPRDTCDMGYYRQLAKHFLESGGQHLLVDVPRDSLAWCDLCGGQFSKSPRHKPEALTGNNFCWCPTCYQQQSGVFFILGAEQYRSTWQAAEAGE